MANQVKAPPKRTPKKPAKGSAGNKSVKKPRRMTRSERRERILDVAIRLAEEGGFENVRQRDVASQAGVALGTLYKYFRGKGDILSAALERETAHLERKLGRKPLVGNTAADRLGNFFEMLTKALCRKPNYARALMRAMTSGDPEITSNIIAYQAYVYSVIISALRGDVTTASITEGSDSTEDEMKLALMLQQMWFAQLVGWSAELFSLEDIISQMRFAAKVLIAGMRAEGAL
jgi:AcrR family transcriptional regulator